MNNNFETFPHISLEINTKGTYNDVKRGRTKKTQTAKNLSNRQGHGHKIQTLVISEISNWQITQQKRQEEDQPKLPEVISLVLEIDPDTFDLDDLRTSNIEIISELEDGFIIGASADTNLTELQQKIEQF